MEVDTEAPHGMRTGNIVTFPNALMLTEPVVNETRVLDLSGGESLYDSGGRGLGGRRLDCKPARRRSWRTTREA